MKILVVEDDELVAQTLAAILSMYRYAVEVVSDGLSALEMLEAFEFDVVILDIFLPKLSGLEVCKKARAQGIQVPILMLTARDSSQDKAAGLDAGADDYVVKPFDPEELIARVRALLRRGRLTQDPTLKWGKLTLDPESCEVRYHQEILPLTPKEYGLLELFLRNPKRVYSCGMILEHLWVHEETPGEEAVRTHIKGLRQKLKAAGVDNDLITTVYGIGYRLKPLSEPDHGVNQQKTESIPSSNSRSDESELNIHESLGFRINDIWRSHQTTIEERVNLIEVAVQAATKQSLSPQSRETAIRNAHALAGSLGTFGIKSGSQVARSIEMLLMAGTELSRSDLTQLKQWVQKLREALDEKKAQTQEIPSTQTLPENALLLLDKDRAYAGDVISAAQALGYSTHHSSTLINAITLVENIEPKAIILDPVIEDSLESTVQFLEELNTLKLNIPIVLYSESGDCEAKISVDTLHIDAYLQKPISAASLMQVVQNTVDNNSGYEATILAVDDDISILALVQALLEPWGMKVRVLSDPAIFWEKLEETQPDLIILDVEMPVHNGIELCKQLRNNASWSEIPILFLTVHGNEAIVNEIFRAGADDYIKKPFVGPELVTRILNRLERSRLLRRLRTSRLNRADTEATVKPDRQAASHSATEETRDKPISTADLLQRLDGELLPNAVTNILNVADDAILCIDDQQNIVFFNMGAERIFGYAAHEILGHSLNELIPQRYNQVHTQHVKGFSTSSQIAKQMSERREIYGARKGGIEFPAEASIAKLGEGKHMLYAVILRDISRRKHDEQIKDEFISTVSHELKTPLTAIKGSLQMLSRGMMHSRAEETNHLLSIAVNSTERLVRLVNDILDVERINSGKIQMNFETHDLAVLAQDAMNEIQSLADQAGVTLEMTTRPVPAWVDYDRILQTLINILNNAIRFSESGQIVSLILKVVSDQAQFEVIDHGRGIPTEKIDYIFERFQQADSSDIRDRQGTGLGLAICRSIVKQHKGSIWVKSEYGKGSHFYVLLPLTPSS